MSLNSEMTVALDNKVTQDASLTVASGTSTEHKTKSYKCKLKYNPRRV